MYRWAQVSTAAACLALAFGCDGEQTEVQRQTRDLQEAQKNIGKVTQELESELAKAKADVIRLEQKVAMARQGMTDDVLENQKELQAALKEQEQRVQSELGEAKREAQIHNRDTEAALKQLGQASVPAAPEGEAVAPPVEGAVPPVTPTDMPSREDMVPVRGGPDTQPEGTADIDRGVTPAPTPGQPVDTTGAVPPPPPAVPPATSTTTTTTKSTTTVPSDTPPSDTPPSDTPTEASPPSTPPPGDMPPPPAPPAQ